MDTAYQMQHLDENLTPQYLAAVIITLVASVIAVILRMISQFMIGSVNVADNYLILIAAAGGITTSAACIYGLQNGLGQHQLRVDAEDPDLPSRTIGTLKAAYVLCLGVAWSLAFVKLSILFFYSRVFTVRKTLFRWALYILGVYSALHGIATFLLWVWQCNPIPYFWNRAYLITGAKPPPGTIMEGTCENQELHLVAPIVTNLFSDLIILILPAIGLWGLQMQMRTKIGIFFAFSVGAFICGIDCIRLYECFSTENDGDTTWDNAGSIVWSAIEVALAVLVACIPTWAPLFARMRGRSLRSRPAGSSGKYGSGNANQFNGRGSLGNRRFQSLSGTSRESNIYKGMEAGHNASTKAFHRPLHQSAATQHTRSDSDDEIPLQGIVVSREIEVSSEHPRENSRQNSSE